ncbi:MAG TPA: sugar phosphate isomerase/epimerase family protein [Burkholderiaceae bacterium]|nr:sugar phosphate isomerase/epimerase family protein [Burkholderiaceae bacterium]
MRDFSQDHRWLSINTATVRKQRGQDWPLPQILDACAARGIRAVSPWRDQVAAAGLDAIARQVKALGLELSGYCRGGMFTHADAVSQQAVRDDNRRALDEACTLNAACLVLVVGGLPGALDGRPAHRDLGAARAQVTEGIAALLEDARQRGMPLAIEPLHPMYAADRACINTLQQALDVCDALDPPLPDGTGRLVGSGALGVAVDAYHVWWDPQLHAQIERAGRARLLALHVCDWLVPTTDLLNDRGMMGDGVIDLKALRASVEAQGYASYSEVEIFSARNWWLRDGGEVLDTCIERHRRCV